MFELTGSYTPKIERKLSIRIRSSRFSLEYERKFQIRMMRYAILVIISKIVSVVFTHFTHVEMQCCFLRNVRHI